MLFGHRRSQDRHHIGCPILMGHHHVGVSFDDRNRERLNDLLPEIEMLIHRAVGSEIQVSFHLADSLWFCRADPNQLESAILNLAINARDAMPKGGSLRVATEKSTLDGAAAALLGDVVPGR